MTPSLAVQVQTVLGAISPEAMGITLPHEHMLIDFEATKLVGIDSCARIAGPCRAE